MNHDMMYMFGIIWLSVWWSSWIIFRRINAFEKQWKDKELNK